MIQKRSIGMCIVLSIITCGIYGLYWLVVLTDDTNRMLEDAQNETSGGMALLFTIITCNIYGLYWMYKQGEKIDRIKTARGIPSSNTGILYLILSFFGLSIISYALMQNELNNLAWAEPGIYNSIIGSVYLCNISSGSYLRVYSYICNSIFRQEKVF